MAKGSASSFDPIKTPKELEHKDGTYTGGKGTDLSGGKTPKVD